MVSRILVGAAALLLPGLVPAQPTLDDVVVTATRSERPVVQTLADVSVIDPPAIERAGASTLPELLRNAAGIEISESGGAGSVSGLFVRGTKTAQTVVLVDGMRLENPTYGGANLEFLPLSAIDRVEIVRGPLSALYGSGAIGGVVQVFTRQGDGPPRAFFSLGGGSLSTTQLQAGVTGAVGEQASTRFALTVSSDRTAGFDATKDTSVNRQMDPDGNAQRSLTGALTQRLGAGWVLGANLFVTRGTAEYDDAFSTPDTGKLDYRTTAFGAYLRGRPLEPWETELRAGRTTIDYRFAAFTYAPNTSTGSFLWRNAVDLPLGRLLFGYEQLRQAIEGEGLTTGDYVYVNDRRRIDSLFAGYEVGFDRNLVRLQVRRDSITTIGVQPTGTLAWGYSLTPAWLLRASYGTAFRAPTFDDLYSPFAGNALLRAELSRAGEVALEYRAAGRLFKATAFASRIRDAIELDAAFVPQNLGSANVQGVTFEGAYTAGTIALRGAATFQDPQGERPDAQGAAVAYQLPRRARSYASFAAQWRPADWRLGFEWVLQGRRVDADGSAMGGYGVVALTASRVLARAWELFGRIGNVFDKDYETAAGYNMPPRTVFVGLRYQPR